MQRPILSIRGWAGRCAGRRVPRSKCLYALPWLVALGLAACGSEPELDLRFVPLPIGEASTYVLRVETTAGEEFHVLDPESRASIELEEDDLLPGAPFMAVGLAATPEQLGLRPGRLPPSAPVGLNVFRAPASVDEWDGEEGLWRTRRDGVPTTLSEYALGDRCNIFRARSLYLDRGNTRFMLPVDETHVLVGLETVTLLATSSVATPVPRRQLANAFTPRSAVATGGAIWMVDGRGWIFRAEQRLPLRFERVFYDEEDPAYDFSSAAEIGGEADEKGVGLFVVGRGSGVADPKPVFQLEASGWRELGRIPDYDGQPLSIGPGRAFLRSDEVGFLYVLGDGRIEVERFGSTALDSLARIEDYGVLGGTVDGDLLLRAQAEEWRRLPGKELGWWVTAMAPYTGGMMAFFASGTTVQYYGNIPCTDQAYRGVVNFGALQQLGEGMLLSGSVDMQAEIIYLSPEP